MRTVNDHAIPQYTETIFHERRYRHCLLIPIINEGENFIRQIARMKENGIFKMTDVVICDAGSTDGSTELQMLRDSGFSALLIRQGYGRYGTDLRMGYSWAIERGYEYLITVDGNNKDDTSALPLFIEKMEQGYNYVQGSRYIAGGKEKNTPLSRKIAIKCLLVPLISLAARKYMTDSSNGFRAYSKDFLMDDAVAVFRDCFVKYEIIYYLPIMACRLGYRVCEVPVTREYPNSKDIPTKVGWKDNLDVIFLLISLLFGAYRPEKVKEKR
jgi:dolichol-phosphate mannosyltransferase